MQSLLTASMKQFQQVTKAVENDFFPDYGSDDSLSQEDEKASGVYFNGNYGMEQKHFSIERVRYVILPQRSRSANSLYSDF